MNTLVEQLLNTLRTHRLLKNVRLLTYDETASGKLEVKIRCQVSKKFPTPNLAPSRSGFSRLRLPIIYGSPNFTLG